MSDIAHQLAHALNLFRLLQEPDYLEANIAKNHKCYQEQHEIEH